MLKTHLWLPLAVGCAPDTSLSDARLPALDAVMEEQGAADPEATGGLGSAPGSQPSTPGGQASAFADASHAAVLLNEVMPANASYVSDEVGDYDDWVELLNPQDASVQLQSWGLSDDVEEPPTWFFPPTTLPAGGRLVVWLDEEPEEGPLHADFRANSDAESVVLWKPDGTVADVMTWQDVGDDLVVGRFPDAGSVVTHSIRATPGNVNPADPGTSRDPSDALFPDDRLITIELFLNDEAYNTLMAHNDAAVEGALAFEGSWMNRVEVSIKGGIGSREDFSDKAAFKVDLNEWVDGQRLRGLEALTLNNMVQDHSLAHETITYRFFREAGLPAPRTAHVLLYINDVFRGIYLNVESIDDRFLERRYDDPEGNLYEGASGADFHPYKIDKYEHDEQGSHDVTDRSDLLAVADLMYYDQPSEGLVDELEALVDVDQVVRYFAAEVMVEHWDGYFFKKNNYKLYHEPSSNLFTMLPWGTDQTLYEKDTQWRGLYDSAGRLGWWMLDIPSVRDRYDDALEELAYLMIELAPEFTDQAWAIYDRVLPWYELSGFEDTKLGDVERELETLETFLQDHPDAVLDKL